MKKTLIILLLFALALVGLWNIFSGQNPAGGAEEEGTEAAAAEASVPEDAETDPAPWTEHEEDSLPFRGTKPAQGEPVGSGSSGSSEIVEEVGPDGSIDGSSGGEGTESSGEEEPETSTESGSNGEEYPEADGSGDTEGGEETSHEEPEEIPVKQTEYDEETVSAVIPVSTTSSALIDDSKELLIEEIIPLPAIDSNVLVKKEQNLGSIAFSQMPEEMEIGKTHFFVASIIQDQNPEEAMEMVEKLGGEQPIESQTIKTSPRMKVWLEANDADAFIIKPDKAETKIVDAESATSWEWDVTPTRSGDYKLKLMAARMIGDIDGGTPKEEIVEIKEYKIESSVVYDVANFFKEYYPGVLSTILGALGIYLVRRFVFKNKDAEL